MTSSERNAMTMKAREGKLEPWEQILLANELEVYNAMALRLEKALHDLIKEGENNG